MIRRWFILGVLAAFLLSLLWNFYREVVAYDPMGALERTERASMNEQPEPGPFKAAWSRDISAKNLFSPRRGYVPPPPPPPPPVVVIEEPPKPAPPPPPPPPSPKRPELGLSGIILNQYGEFIAFIKVSGGLKRVMQGDTFEGLEVIGISPRAVTLLWEGEEITLSMKKIKKL